jgi:hypothetical protein
LEEVAGPGLPAPTGLDLAASCRRRRGRFRARRRVHPSTAGEYLKEPVQSRRRGHCRPGSGGPGSFGHGSAGRGWRSRAAAPAWRRRSGSGGEGAGRGRGWAEETRGGGVHTRLRCSTPGIARRGGAPAKCSKRCRLRWSSYSSRRCCILQMQQRLQTPLESVLVYHLSIVIVYS